MYSSEPLPHLVDDYLSYLYETCPTTATFDGVHAYDDHLEDLSRSAVDSEVRELSGFARRLEAISPATLTPVEQIERPILEAAIRGRIFELEEVRAWERSPQHYADTLSTSLASQAVFDYAPAADRARRVLSKLRQTPRLLQAARDNVKDPPGILVKASLETLRGLLKFIEHDLPRAFAAVDDLDVLSDLADASTEAVAGIGSYVTFLEEVQGPKSKGSFRLGRERLERKLRLGEGVTLDCDRLLAIAMRELRETQEEFRRVASRLDAGDPGETWRTVKRSHPDPGQLVRTAAAQVDELATFVERHGLVSIPGGDRVIVAPTPRFYRWTFASLWAPGPFETKPVRSHYYLTDVDPSWPPERAEEHLRDFNHAALWSISIHETYPGHFLHYQHLRQVTSRLRKSLFFAPMSFVEGWAHYAEQMMVEAGFGDGDPSMRLGQLAEALVRLSRLVVGLRLHAADLSVEQGVRFFREEAFLEEGSARREAERGTFDPGYVVYSLGRLMMLKLRADYKQAQGSKYSLRAFHDTVLGHGTAPFWAHRKLMLGDNAGEALV